MKKEGSESKESRGEAKIDVENSVRGLSNYFWNCTYITVGVLLMLSAIVWMMRHFSFTVGLIGIQLFIFGFFVLLLEIIHPSSLAVWLPIWKRTIGRSITLLFLCSISLLGSFIIGLIALSLTVFICIGRLLIGKFESPEPIFENRQLYMSLDSVDQGSGGSSNKTDLFVIR
jgi:cation transport ATPase